jgi:hypothetical protein
LNASGRGIENKRIKAANGLSRACES